MNAFKRAKDSLAELAGVLASSGMARMAFHDKRQLQPKPRAVQLVIRGKTPIKLVDADTGRVLGFRQDYLAAKHYARELEQGAA